MKSILRLRLGRGLLVIEYFLHVIVAVLLMGAALETVILVGKDILNFSYLTVFNLINNALLLLIIKEVLWSVIKFFRKENFSISSFLFIGVISGVRQILFLEAQKSIEKTGLLNLSIEMGLNAFMILALIAGYYLFVKADNLKRISRS